MMMDELYEELDQIFEDRNIDEDIQLEPELIH